MPQISVILPLYNGEATLKETIDSVLNQTFKDLELVIVNDGSQDASLEIITSIKDSRIKVFSYSNAGVSASRNRGISQATGEYISFIDQDDIWTTDKLETQLKALQNNPQATVAYSWTNYIDESGNFLHPGSYISVTGNVYANLLLVNFLENGSNPLIRAQAFTEVGKFDESLKSIDDWEMWVRLAARYQFVSVPLPQILYRQSAGSASGNVWRMEAEGKRVRERIFAQVPKSLQYLNQWGLGNRYKYLTFKALEGTPERHKSLTALRFIWLAIKYDPNLLKTRVIWKVLFKIATGLLLPSQLAQKVLGKAKNLADISTLMLHIRTELPSNVK